MVTKELNLLIEKEEISWRQKSRALWFKVGDRCTNFFHHVANFNRRVNSISSFEVKGEIVEDPAIISEEIVNLYSSLYKEPFSWITLLDDLEFDSIFVDYTNLLERPFDEDEVIGLVQSLNGEKARG